MTTPSLRDRLIDLNASYASAIDNDDLEAWPAHFVADCFYSVTTAENLREGLPAGLIHATSRAMLEDRVSSLRNANIYERQRYRHMLGLPRIRRVDGDRVECQVPFLVVRIVQDDETFLFMTGVYEDVVRIDGDAALFERRVVVSDSKRFDTLLAVPV